MYESLPEGDCPGEGFPDGFFMTTMKKLAYGGVALVPIVVGGSDVWCF